MNTLPQVSYAFLCHFLSLFLHVQRSKSKYNDRSVSLCYHIIVRDVMMRSLLQCHQTHFFSLLRLHKLCCGGFFLWRDPKFLHVCSLNLHICGRFVLCLCLYDGHFAYRRFSSRSSVLIALAPRWNFNHLIHCDLMQVLMKCTSCIPNIEPWRSFIALFLSFVLYFSLLLNCWCNRG